jgi:hypothetical protein
VAGPLFDHLARTFGAISAGRQTRRMLGGDVGLAEPRERSIVDGRSDTADPPPVSSPLDAGWTTARADRLAASLHCQAHEADC